MDAKYFMFLLRLENCIGIAQSPSIESIGALQMQTVLTNKPFLAFSK